MDAGNGFLRTGLTNVQLDEANAGYYFRLKVVRACHSSK